jgi:guanylate kinase
MIKEVEEGKFIESATFSGNMYGNVVKKKKAIFVFSYLNLKSRYFN